MAGINYNYTNLLTDGLVNFCSSYSETTVAPPVITTGRSSHDTLQPG